MRKPIAPCHKCDKRSAECKIICEKWKEYERDCKEYKECIAKSKADDYVVSEYFYSRRKGSGEGGSSNF